MSEKETRTRAEFVAALREIADLVEADTSLPVPYSVSMQGGIAPHEVQENGTIRHFTQAERFAVVRRAASALGVDVIEEKNLSRRAVRWFGPVQFTTYASPDAQPIPEPQPRIVPAAEDADLIGGAA